MEKVNNMLKGIYKNSKQIKELNVKNSITKGVKGKMVEQLTVGICTPTTTVQTLCFCCIHSGTLESL